MLRNRYHPEGKCWISLAGALICSSALAASDAATVASSSADLSCMIAKLRQSGPLPADEVLNRIRAASPTTSQWAWPGPHGHPIEDEQLSPRQDFIVLVNNQGMVGALPIGPAKADFDIVNRGFTEAELKAHKDKRNDANAFIVRGWGPPISEYDADVVSGRERALIMGLDLRGNLVWDTPAFRWEFVPQGRDDVALDCTVLVLRKNYTDKSFISGSDISSICRAGSNFTYKLLYSGRIGSVAVSPTRSGSLSSPMTDCISGQWTVGADSKSPTSLNMAALCGSTEERY